jgi:hypothetical protein
LLGVVWVIAGAGVFAGQGNGDPNCGKWRLNLEKSQFDPGPAAESQMVTISIEDGVERYSSDGVDARGMGSSTSFSAKIGGGDTGALGILYGDTISITEPSPGHLVAVIKKDGKVTITAHADVAADGKSRMVTYSGKTADGKEIKDKLYYDKVT